MMLYDIAKAVHITSVIVWIAGMTVAAMTLRTQSARTSAAIQTFDRKVTTPAMLLAWAFGIYVAVQGGWFGDAWLSVKIFFVLILSGLHGMITGRLRKKTWEGDTYPDPATRLVVPIGFGLLISIVLLVTTKAF